MSKQYNQVYLDSYTKQFRCIKKSRKGSHFAFCSVCCIDIKVAHGGISDIKDHIKSKRHVDFIKIQEKTPKMETFFNSGDNTDIINAECLATCFLLEHNLPIAVADHIGPLVRRMFPKSETAKKYACGRTKTTAIIEKMSQVNKRSLVDLLQNRVFTIATDGSNDSDSQLYPIVITYFDSQESKIENKLLSVPVLSGHSTGLNIGNLLLTTLQSMNIDIKNCIALGADNAPVMIGHKSGVAAVLKSKNQELIVIGCICHLINLAAEKATNSLPVAIEDYLIDIFYYLEKSAKRKEELKELQSLYDVGHQKILKHVCTRWLSLGKSLNRLLEQWEPLMRFFKDRIKQRDESLEMYRIPLKTSKKEHTATCEENIQPSSSKKRPSSYNQKQLPKKMKVAYSSKGSSLTKEERVFMFLSSDTNKAYSLFLAYIIPIFERSNVILQSGAPKIHILNSLLVDMLKEILSKFVIPAIIKNCAILTEVKYADRCNQKNDDELIIGSAALKIVKQLKEDEKEIFYLSIRQFYVTCCNYMRHKFPINSDVLKHAEVSDISKICNKSFSDIDFFLSKFPIMLSRREDETEDEARDKIQSEFCSLQVMDFPEDVNNEERMDRKWALLSKVTSADGILKYNRLCNVMLSILTIPHSNAECERIFSSVKKTRTQFRSSLSDENLENILIAKNMIKDNCFDQKFDTEFLKTAKSATYTHNLQLTNN